MKIYFIWILVILLLLVILFLCQNKEYLDQDPTKACPSNASYIGKSDKNLCVDTNGCGYKKEGFPVCCDEEICINKSKLKQETTDQIVEAIKNVGSQDLDQDCNICIQNFLKDLGLQLNPPSKSPTTFNPSTNTSVIISDPNFKLPCETPSCEDCMKSKNVAEYLQFNINDCSYDTNKDNSICDKYKTNSNSVSKEQICYDSGLLN